MALYRAGRFDEAVATLTRSDEIYVRAGRGQQPADWAFIAMARWKLGQHELARAAFETFQSLAAKDEWKAGEEVLAWQKELEVMIPKP